MDTASTWSDVGIGLELGSSALVWGVRAVQNIIAICPKPVFRLSEQRVQPEPRAEAIV